jgi:MFS family permease
MAFQTTSPAILCFRFAAGIGIGMELVVIDTYLSELVPKTSRGRAFAFNQLLSFSAIPVVALLSLFLVPRSFLGIDGWRWVALIGSTGAFLVFIARRNLPESPRWLEQSGRQRVWTAHQLSQPGRDQSASQTANGSAAASLRRDKLRMITNREFKGQKKASRRDR